MANLISVERATLALGTAHILDGVSLGINEGARIGIVGRNGGGKSTLMKVLHGDLALDDGRITRSGSATVGMLSQADVLDASATVREVVLRDRAEHEWAGDPRIRDVVDGLLGGLDAAAMGGWDAVVGPMSGGERRRLALAQILVDDPDVLLLDEPTNHLDVEGVAWLADHLVRHRARPDNALATITHDRWFLDAVADRTWEVVDGQVEQYEGGYAATTCCARSSPGCGAGPPHARASRSSASTPPTRSSPTNHPFATRSSSCASRRPGSARTSSTSTTPPSSSAAARCSTG
jgi:ATP-binding cassette subfamily F protein uup